MKKLTFLLALFLMTSWMAYGQEVLGYGTIFKRGYSLTQPVPQIDFSPKSGDLWLNRGELKRSGSFSETHLRVGRIDPFMPIVVPPNNPIKFPVKVIPEDFPSNMPVARMLDPIYQYPSLRGKSREK